MKTFWRQVTVFSGVVAVVALAVFLFFYFNGVGSYWVAHQQGGQTDKNLIGSDIASLAKIIRECEQTPATEEQIEEYTTTDEWQGYIFIDTKANKVFAFSQNFEMLAIYRPPATTTTVSHIPNSSADGEADSTTLPEINYEYFSFYQCTPEFLQQVEKIYSKYYK